MSSFYDLASLVMIPSGKKAGKVYSQKPLSTDGQLDFTRASTATRIGSDGLIEKTRTNLLLQSNSFDTTWVNTNTTETGGQSGYDGLSNAWKLTATATSSAYIRQIISFSNLKTLSVYAKAGASSHLLMLTEGGGNTWFDLVNGIIETDAAVLSNMESIGNGWYRCSVTWDSSITGVRLYVCDANGTSSVANGGNIYIQNAQLEQGLVATNVITTTTAAVSVGSVDNMPRLNYTEGSATSCPSLLLEPQRTNIVPQSEYFEGSGWSLDGGTQSVTSNYSISPEGVKNAARLQLDKTGTTYSRLYVNAGSIGAATISVYMKSNTSQTQNVGLRYEATGVNCEVTTEWKRFDLTATSTSISRFQILLFDSIAGNDETADISIYGAQMEAISYATSYIPTFGATVTRVADVCENGGSSATFNDSEGVIFIESSAFAADSTNKVMTISDGTTANRVQIYYNSSNNIIGSVAGQADISYSTDITQNLKIAFKYKLNDFALWVNGVEVGTDNLGTVPSGLQELSFDNGASGSNFYGNIKKLIYLPTALTDAQLTELTSIDS